MIRLRSEKLALPEYETTYSSGFDIKASEDGVVPQGQTVAIPTGLFIDKPCWIWKYLSWLVVPELQIRSRSGLSLKKSVMVGNGVGTIEIDYDQEIKVIMFNHSNDDFYYKMGDRIAQGVIALSFRSPSLRVKQVVRKGGFNSTGV